MKPLVYLAAPYSSNPTRNVHEATLLGLDLWRAGAVTPYVPHWSMLGDLIMPMSYDEWLAFDRDVILHCDAVLWVPGTSPGAELEVAFAEENRIPVFSTVEALMVWVAGR